MAKKIQYQLYGVVNLMDNVPAFIFPIFERNGNYYFGHCNDSSTYNYFEIIESGNIINKIRPLAKISNKTLVSIKKAYVIGDQVVYGMEQSPNAIYMAPIDKMLDTLENYQTSDIEFKKEIDVVKKEIKTLI